MNIYTKLTTQFPNLSFEENKPLAPFTTVKIGGPAEVYCETKNREDFVAVVSYCKKNDIPLTILGWGANSLISDQGIKGLVMRNLSNSIEILGEAASTQLTEKQKVAPRWEADEEYGTGKYQFNDLDYDESDAEVVKVRMDSGVSLPVAINTLLGQGITGLQWYARIPATIGGAIYNNIHGGTHFIDEVIESVDVITHEGELETLQHDQLEAGYDFSRFHKSGEVIVSAIFTLYKGDVEKAKHVAREWAVRKKVQPANSLGCVFQNITSEDQKRLGYPTPSVGYIVEHILGLKGFQIGDAKVSEKHCAFIENVGNATAKDYKAIIDKIISETEVKTGIILKPEIFFLGF